MNNSIQDMQVFLLLRAAMLCSTGRSRIFVAALSGL
jgi:hypothetical protein